MNIKTPEGLSKNNEALVESFASAIAEKLLKNGEKYGWIDQWMDPDWEEECQEDMLIHVAKGDPIDVAIYCAFMFHHKWPTIPESRKENFLKIVREEF